MTTMLWHLMGPPLIAIFAIFIAYTVLFRRLAQAVQPTRLRLAEDGEALLASGTLTPADEAEVMMFLNNAYNGWFAAQLLILMPCAMFLLLVGKAGDDEDIASEKLLPLMGRFALSGFAANPICGTLAALEYVGLVIGAVLIWGSFAAAQRASLYVIRRIAGVPAAPRRVVEL